VGEGLLAEGAGAYEHLAQETAGVALHFEGLFQLGLGNQMLAMSWSPNRTLCFWGAAPFDDPFEPGAEPGTDVVAWA